MGGVKGAVIFSVADVCEILRERQKNNFDANFGVSGKRGNGKSTLILKILSRFKKDGFNQEKHQVYERKDVMELLSSQKYSFCWDDEAINSGYKRDFQNQGQHELIKLVTNYRDNFNIYASALPFFYSLDKDLRELIFLHIHIIERGLAVIFLPMPDQIHKTDPWDTKFNEKVEEQETKRLAKNPLAKFRYHRFSTFAGYLHFTDVTEKQKVKYLEIKHRKRANRFENSLEIGKGKEPDFYDYVLNRLKAGKLSRDNLISLCELKGKNPLTVEKYLQAKLKSENEGLKMGQLLRKDNKPEEKETNEPSLALEIPVFS